MNITVRFSFGIKFSPQEDRLKRKRPLLLTLSQLSRPADT
jgi:hypothetical protein